MQAEGTQPVERAGRPHAPGFPHRLLEAAGLNTRLGWLVYTVVAVAVTLVYWGVAWSEGTLPTRASLMHLALPIFAFAGLPALAWFNRLARRSLRSAQPVLTGDEAAYERLAHRLTTMPTALAVGAAALGLLALAGLTAFQPPDTYERLQIMVTPIATVIEWIFQFMTWVGVGVGGVEIARKLWVIDDIYRNHVQMNVLRPGPLSAFSRLAAGMVIFTLVAVVLGTMALGELASTTLWWIGGGLPTILAAIAFVAPLWGAHRLMAQEKMRSVDALNEMIETTIGRLRATGHADRLDDAEPLTTTLEGLIAARNEYRAVSTWPWQRSTLGSVVTALAAPLGVWVLTRLLERVVIP
ncbi:hypothetical protein BH23CHL7_BH23CHL7_05800 [soil metagenome]